MKMKIQDLEELSSLSKKDMDLVLQEYKKKYHFLLFYWDITRKICLILFLWYIMFSLNGMAFLYKICILVIMSYLISLLIDFIEVNFVAKKVITDLIRNIEENEK